MNAVLTQALPTLIPFAVLLLLWRRITRTRKVRMERLWIAPTIAAIGAAALFYFSPQPKPTTLAILAVTTLLGGALGWYRGALTRLTVDAQTHDVSSRASAAGVILILSAFALRQGAHAVLNGYGAQWHVNALLVSNAFLLFAIGMVMVQRLEIFLRCRKMLAEARAAKITGAPAPTR